MLCASIRRGIACISVLFASKCATTSFKGSHPRPKSAISRTPPGCVVWNQGLIPFVLVMSIFYLGTRYKAPQWLGALVICAGLGIALYPSIAAPAGGGGSGSGSGSDGAGGSGNGTQHAALSAVGVSWVCCAVHPLSGRSGFATDHTEIDNHRPFAYLTSSGTFHLSGCFGRCQVLLADSLPHWPGVLPRAMPVLDLDWVR